LHEAKHKHATEDKYGDESSENDDEFTEKTGTDLTFASKDPRVRTTNRNLRIREDTAKYLWNLNPNSAAYDPKSRKMKENPNPDLRED